LKIRIRGKEFGIWGSPHREFAEMSEDEFENTSRGGKAERRFTRLRKKKPTSKNQESQNLFGESDEDMDKAEGSNVNRKISATPTPSKSSGNQRQRSLMESFGRGVGHATDPYASTSSKWLRYKCGCHDHEAVVKVVRSEDIQTKLRNLLMGKGNNDSIMPDTMRSDGEEKDEENTQKLSSALGSISLPLTPEEASANEDDSLPPTMITEEDCDDAENVGWDAENSNAAELLPESPGSDLRKVEGQTSKQNCAKPYSLDRDRNRAKSFREKQNGSWSPNLFGKIESIAETPKCKSDAGSKLEKVCMKDPERKLDEKARGDDAVPVLECMICKENVPASQIQAHVNLCLNQQERQEDEKASLNLIKELQENEDRECRRRNRRFSVWELRGKRKRKRTKKGDNKMRRDEFDFTSDNEDNDRIDDDCDDEGPNDSEAKDPSYQEDATYEGSQEY